MRELIVDELESVGGGVMIGGLAIFNAVNILNQPLGSGWRSMEGC